METYDKIDSTKLSEAPITNKSFDLKKFGHELVIRIQRMGFWMLVLIALGCLIGVYYSKMYYNTSIEDSIKMQRMIHNNVIYDITISPITQPK